MKTLLWYYLSGVIMMFILVIIANKDVKFKEIKIVPFLKLLLICLGSWVSIYVIAAKNL